MPYKITINNKYPDGTTLREQFDTNSVLLQDAFEEARMEAYAIRWIRNRKRGFPIQENITCKPTGDIK